MPVLENIHVQLSEVVEVRGAPLAEYELWAVLCLTLDTIQDLFLRGAAFKDGVPTYLPTPETLQCTSSGRIIISSVAIETTNRTCWAPELVNNNLGNSEDELGKVYVYALAKTIQYALDFNYSVQSNWFSPFLSHTLLLMEQENTSTRMNLQELSEVCTRYVGMESNDSSLTSVVVQLHQEVLGSLPEAEILEQVDSDFMEENKRMSFSVTDDEQYKYGSQPVVLNQNLNDCIYGHRLGYRGLTTSSSSSSSSRKTTRFNARERWRQAFKWIANNRKKQNLNNLNNTCSSVLDNCRAQPSVSKVYQELAERRRMVDLLRMNIDVGQSAVKVNNKGLKPQTLAELVLLLKNNPTKAEPTMPSDCSFSSLSLKRTEYYSDELNRSGSLDSSSPKSECLFYTTPRNSSLSTPGLNKSVMVPCGPEFILNKAVPTIPLDLCSKRRNQDGTSRGLPYNLTVVLLTGQHLEVTCDQNISGTTLFHAVAHHIMLQEHYIFGLAVNRDNEFLFLDGRQRLHKTLSLLTSDNVSENGPLILFLRIKYYLNDFNLIKQQTTRHLYYLQTRQDLLSQRFRCQRETVSTLSGLALQAEFGDRQSKESYFLPEHYVPEAFLQHYGLEETTSILVKKHSQNSGISTDMAELQFLQNVCELQEYGYHFHRVLQDKHDSSSEVWLGISSQGTDIFEDRGQDRHKCQAYPWLEIEKLSFTNKSFNITPKSVSLTGRSVKYIFHTSGIFKSRYLFNMAVGHHQFFVKLKSGANASEIIMEDIDLENGVPRVMLAPGQTQAETDEEIECKLDGETSSRSNSSWLSSVRTKYFDSLHRINEFGLKKFPDFHEVMERCSRSPSGRIPDRSCSEKRSAVTKSWSLSKHLWERGSPSRKRASENEETSLEEREGLGGGKIVIKPLPLTAYQRKVLSGAVNPAQPVEPIISNTDVAVEADVDSNIPIVTRHTVRLEKDAENGFGLVLTCGNTPDTVITGTYIETVLSGNSASEDILPGDKVISLNGRNVENNNYLEVAEHLLSLPGPAVLGLLRATPRGQLGKPRNTQKEDSSPGGVCTDSGLIQESDATMDTSFFNEDDQGPPKPHPRRKRSQKSFDRICHGEMGNSRGLNDTPSVPQRADHNSVDEQSTLNGRSPQVSSTCAQTNPRAGSPAVNESTPILNRQCVEEDPVLRPPSEFDTCWRPESALRFVPTVKTTSHGRNSLYSWNLNRRSASPDCDEGWSGYDCGARDETDAECGDEVCKSSEDDVRAGDDVTAGVSMNCAGTDIPPSQEKQVRCESEQVGMEECDAGSSTHNVKIETKTVSKFTVHLTKQEGSFGFRVTERYQFGEEYERGVFVHSLVPDGPAEQDETIEPGDKLVRINGSKTESLSYQESVVLLKKCPTTCKLQFERRGRKSEETEQEMIAKWGRRGSRTSLTSLNGESDGSKPFYGRSVSQTSLPPVHLPTVCTDLRPRCNSAGEEKTSLPRVLNGVVRTSPNLSIDDPVLDQYGTFPRKSKSKSPSLCEDTLSDDVFPGSNGSPVFSSHFPTRPYYVRSESAPSLAVPKTQHQRNCSSPCSLQLGSVPEDYSLDQFDRNLTSPYDAECDREEVVMSGSATMYTFSNSSSHERPAVNGSFEGQAHTLNSLTEPERDHPLPNVRKKRAGLLDKPEDVFKYLNSSNTFDVLLQKTSRGLGLGIFGGSDLDRLGPVCQLIRVRKLYPLQAAMESGKINVGDVILQVNGQSTLGLKHTEALELLRVAPMDVTLKIYRPNAAVMPPVSFYIKDVSPSSSFLISPPGSACSTLTRPKNHSIQEEYEACLTKKEGSLGFSLFRHEHVHEDDCHPTGIYIKALVRDPAISHGRLAPGDRILKVNGVEVSKMSHAEAISFLRNASETVTLRLCSNTDQLWPQCLEDDRKKPVKPLRKEAVDMLTNRAKYKDSKTSPRRLRQRRNGSDSHSSSDDTSEVGLGSPLNNRTVPNIHLTNSPEVRQQTTSPVISEKKTSLSDSNEKQLSSSSVLKDKQSTNSCAVIDEKTSSSVLTDKEKAMLDIPTESGLGLVRNLRPKSLDGLSFNEKKQSSNVSDRIDGDLPFARQGSVLEPGVNEVGTEGAGLLKWRGATLADSTSQSSGSMNLSELQASKKELELVLTPSPTPTPPQRIHSLPSADEDSIKQNGHVASGKNNTPQVVKVYIELDRGWHGRLGFSLSDILPGEKPNPLSNYTSPVVRAVHPGSIAQKDGRVWVGDRLVMVNGESMVDRPAAEVIDLLRKTRGKMRMDFLRVQRELDNASQSSNCS